MKSPRLARRSEPSHADRPDVEGAARKLEQIKAQRPDVENLVAALHREKHLNHFTASVIVVFRGGRK